MARHIDREKYYFLGKEIHTSSPLVECSVVTLYSVDEVSRNGVRHGFYNSVVGHEFGADKLGDEVRVKEMTLLPKFLGNEAILNKVKVDVDYYIV